MNYNIEYNDAFGVFVVKTSGIKNADDFIALAEELLRHPNWLVNSDVLFDHTALDFGRVSIDDLQKIRAFHIKNEERIGNGKSAIVLKSGSSDEWNKLWSQGKKIKTANRTKIFEDYNDSVKWIAGKED